MAEREMKHMTAGSKALADPVHYIYPPAGFWIIERVACHLTDAATTGPPTTGAGMIVYQYRDDVSWTHYRGTIGATLLTNELVWNPDMTMEGGRDYLCFSFTNGTATDIGSVHLWMRRVSSYSEESKLP